MNINRITGKDKARSTIQTWGITFAEITERMAECS